MRGLLLAVGAAGSLACAGAAHAATLLQEGIADDGFIDATFVGPPIAADRYRLTVTVDAPVYVADVLREEYVRVFQWADWLNDWYDDGKVSLADQCGGTPSAASCLPNSRASFAFNGPLEFTFTAYTPYRPTRKFIKGQDDVEYAGAGQIFISAAVQEGARYQIFVAPLPEPATWATMLLGFGAVGSILRRRQKLPVGSGAPLPV